MNDHVLEVKLLRAGVSDQEAQQRLKAAYRLILDARSRLGAPLATDSDGIARVAAMTSQQTLIGEENGNRELDIDQMFAYSTENRN